MDQKVSDSLSMKVCSVKAMQEADRRAIQLGIPGCVLMYNAGKSVVDFILAQYADVHEFTILAGKGNNAGDGFVIAHLLVLAGRAVRVLCFSPQTSYVADALLYLNLCLKEKLRVEFPETQEQMVAAVGQIDQQQVIIDSILGTGVRGQVRDPFASVIRAIPSVKAVVAVDLPSGLDGDSGEICGVCVKATHTITFARAKSGLVKQPDFTGNIVVTDIGIPPICLDDAEWAKLSTETAS
jgi:NAD(P)H-hydrate epimerase